MFRQELSLVLPHSTLPTRSHTLSPALDSAVEQRLFTHQGVEERGWRLEKTAAKFVQVALVTDAKTTARCKACRGLQRFSLGATPCVCGCGIN